MINRIVLVTGGFDPIHSGHIGLFTAAKQLGDYLIVGINSDHWLARKKGSAFLPMHERKTIIENLAVVDRVIEFDDNDDTACHAIETLLNEFPNSTIVFANGGDRNKSNIPEKKINSPRLEFAFGVGGNDKKNSSSWILNSWANRITKRPWGQYNVMLDVPGTKVKELVVDPFSSLSMQKHSSRNELWIVVSGECAVDTTFLNGSMPLTQTLKKHEIIHVTKEQWHRLYNPYSVPCILIEIQYGDMCTESDIERRDA